MSSLHGMQADHIPFGVADQGYEAVFADGNFGTIDPEATATR